MEQKLLHEISVIDHQQFDIEKAKAAELLKPNGVLVYSTCTVTLSENEGIVAWALQTFPNLKLLEIEPQMGNPGWPGTGLTEENRKYVQRFGPNDAVDSIGFFIAKFIKK